MDSVMDSPSNHSDHSMSSVNDSIHHSSNNNQVKNSLNNLSSASSTKSSSSSVSYKATMNRHSPGSPSNANNSSPVARHMDLPSPNELRMSRDRASESLLLGNGAGIPGMGLGLSHHHQQLSPNSNRDNGALNSLVQSRIGHLPPHGLGLLNSFNQMIHHGANPLELMAAAHHHHQQQGGGSMPRSSSSSSYLNISNQSPPPISTSDPTANECKLVDYRGQKVAAFIIAGDTMLCLPQAFELFLKHLVGGLHTVYTKLKRLDIVPLVCNVEQVRILRGLGAIQPGVNRCKLLSCKDFDVLYRDCTTARCLSVKPPESSRPGRPPKRGPVGLSLPASHLSHHPQLKKHRLDNGDYPYENGHLSDMSRLEKSPLLANGYNPPPTHLNHMQFMQMNHHPGAGLLNPGSMPPHGMSRPDSAALLKGQSGMPGMEAIARSGIWENCRAAYEDIVKHLERLREERGEDRAIALDQKPRDLSSHHGSSNGPSPVLNLSKSGHDQNSIEDRSDRSEDPHSAPPSIRDEDDNMSDDNVSEIDEREEKDEDLSDNEHQHGQHPASHHLMSHHSPSAPVVPISTAGGALPPHSAPNSVDCHQEALNYSSLAAVAARQDMGSPTALQSSGAVSAAANQSSPLSSTETLLRNIQSLLKVAADNARQQERQITYEKAELKMDVLREREFKDTLERQLTDEQKLRIIYQKRFKKEKRSRLRIQQQLELEMKRRGQLEDVIKASGAPAEALRLIAESMSSAEKSGERHRSASRDRTSTASPMSASGGAEGTALGNGNAADSNNNNGSSGTGSVDSNRSSNGSSDSLPGSMRRSGGGGAGGGSGGGGSGGDRDNANSNNASNNASSFNSNNPNTSTTSNNGTSSSAPSGQHGSGASSSAGNTTTTAASNNGSGSQQNSHHHQHQQQPQSNDGKPWNYSNLDLMATGAFWQNYSESLAQELELERKARQHSGDREVKSPLQSDRQNYYKNSMLFSSAT